MKKKDPPDASLWLDGTKYAVEVTRILHEEDRRIAVSQWRLVEEAERLALESGQLSGRYIVDLHKPLRDGRERVELRDRILAYVGATREDRVAGPDEIKLSGRIVARIRKYHHDGARIFPVNGGVNLGGFEGDVRDQLTELLSRTFAAKVKIARRMPCPTILVAYNLFPFADEQMFCACARGLSDAKLFHTVYIVEDHDSGYAALTRF